MMSESKSSSAYLSSSVLKNGWSFQHKEKNEILGIKEGGEGDHRKGMLY